MVKIVKPDDIIEYIKSKKVEKPEQSLKRARAFFRKENSGESDGDDI